AFAGIILIPVGVIVEWQMRRRAYGFDARQSGDAATELEEKGFRVGVGFVTGTCGSDLKGESVASRETGRGIDEFGERLCHQRCADEENEAESDFGNDENALRKMARGRECTAALLESVDKIEPGG